MSGQGPRALSQPLRSGCARYLLLSRATRLLAKRGPRLQIAGACAAGSLALAAVSIREPAWDFAKSIRNRRRRFFASKAFILANCVMYGMQVLSKDRLTFLCSKSAEGVLGHGQWWRLGTCHFMHIHPAHLAINMMSLWHMREIEEDFGKARYLCVYAASCISCSLLSLWRNPRQSVGASGAVAGLVAAQLVFNMRHKGQFPKELDPLLDTGVLDALTCVGTNAALGLLCRSRIDNWGHLGGFIGGAVAAWLLGPALKRQGDCLVDSPPWRCLPDNSAWLNYEMFTDDPEFVQELREACRRGYWRAILYVGLFMLGPLPVGRRIVFATLPTSAGR